MEQTNPFSSGQFSTICSTGVSEEENNQCQGCLPYQQPKEQYSFCMQEIRNLRQQYSEYTSLMDELEKKVNEILTGLKEKKIDVNHVTRSDPQDVFQNFSSTIPSNRSYGRSAGGVHFPRKLPRISEIGNPSEAEESSSFHQYKEPRSSRFSDVVWTSLVILVIYSFLKLFVDTLKKSAWQKGDP